MHNLRIRVRISGAVFLVALMTCTCATSLAEPIEIGSRRELFVDRLLIESLDGVNFELHHPVKAPRPVSPLPERHMVTVIKDGDRYLAYWRGSESSDKGPFQTGHPGETVHYAESSDGHEWTFPDLGIHEVSGTKHNNVILAKQPPFLTNFVPFLDTKPGVPVEERFKALAGYPGPGDKRGLTEAGHGLFAFYSGDGISWTKKQEVIPYQPEWRHAFDSPNVAFWSAAEQLYVCYFRTWTAEERLRSISRTTSPDFVNWSHPVAMNPNLPGEHLYTNQTHPYVRAPHLYIALPTRFVPGRGDSPDYDQKDVNATDILLMTTRAGSTLYNRTFTEAYIRPGLDPERWRNRSNYVALNVVPTSPTELSIYHRSGDRYVLRTDGFISLKAGAEVGEMITKPFTFSGTELCFNYSTSAAGDFRVELQEPDGSPLPGFSLTDCVDVFGDRVDGQVNWHGKPDLEKLSGKPIRMRIQMQECDLYSFRFQ